MHDKLNPFSVQQPKAWKLSWFQSAQKTWLLRAEEIEKQAVKEENFYRPIRRDSWMRTFLPRTLMVETFSVTPNSDTPESITAENALDRMTVEWVEPGAHSDEPKTFSIPASMAVEHAKKVAAVRGHTYKDDSEALNDFITVHWATLKIAHSPENVHKLRTGAKYPCAYCGAETNGFYHKSPHDCTAKRPVPHTVEKVEIAGHSYRPIEKRMIVNGSLCSEPYCHDTTHPHLGDSSPAEKRTHFSETETAAKRMGPLPPVDPELAKLLAAQKTAERQVAKWPEWKRTPVVFRTSIDGRGGHWETASPAEKAKTLLCPDCNHAMSEHSEYGCNHGDANDHPATWCRCKYVADTCVNHGAGAQWREGIAYCIWCSGRVGKADPTTAERQDAKWPDGTRVYAQPYTVDGKCAKHGIVVVTHDGADYCANCAQPVAALPTPCNGHNHFPYGASVYHRDCPACTEEVQAKAAALKDVLIDTRVAGWAATAGTPTTVEPATDTGDDISRGIGTYPGIDITTGRAWPFGFWRR